MRRNKSHEKTIVNIDTLLTDSVNKLNKHRQLILNNKIDYFTGVAFVSFEKIWEAEYFI